MTRSTVARLTRLATPENASVLVFLLVGFGGPLLVAAVREGPRGDD